MKIYTSLLLLFFFSLQILTAQNIKVEEEYAVAKMMTRYAEISKTKMEVPGWRIQLVATTDRRKLETTKEDFIRNHPEIPIDWEHAKPYYRLRAGAFKTKLEAIRVLHRLKKDYPSAFPAKVSNILIKDLVGA
ncbi:MAG: SPOR domain-containing protein [Saprospiraceae bacterium]